MHLLRAVPGSLPGGRDRGRPQFRILHRDPRRIVLRQGPAARQWRPLGARNRPQFGIGCAVSMKTIIPYSAWPASEPAIHRDAPVWESFAAADAERGRHSLTLMAFATFAGSLDLLIRCA